MYGRLNKQLVAVSHLYVAVDKISKEKKTNFKFNINNIIIKVHKHNAK